MGTKQSTTEFEPCRGAVHMFRSFDCMGGTCAEARIICRNRQCGFVSSKNTNIWLCRLCRIAEKNKDSSSTEQNDILDRPKLNLVASVTYNKENNRFNYNEDFFKHIAEVDDA